MDTNTLARLEMLREILSPAYISNFVLRQNNVNKLYILIEDTISGNYDYVGEPMKDEKAFNEKKGICYIPEASDQAYTYFDIAAITGDNHKTTERVFQLCTWQHPETVFEEGVREGEWTSSGISLTK